MVSIIYPKRYDHFITDKDMNRVNFWRELIIFSKSALINILFLLTRLTMAWKTGHKLNQPLGEYDNCRDAALGTVDLMAL